MRARIKVVAPGEAGTYPSPTVPATKVGDVVYFAGIVGLDGARRLIGAGDAGAQADRALTTIDSALAALGGRLADVVRVTVYLVDDTDLAAVGDVFDRRFGRPWPSTTMVQVAALAKAELLVEIEPIAVIHDSQEEHR